jgi:hypothetical protein
MKNLAMAISLMLYASYALSADFKSDDSKMKIFEAYAAAAGAAGSAEKCGIADVDPEKVLVKIARALRCDYNDGQITAEDADEMMKGIAYIHDKGRQASPSPKMCEAAEFLVIALLDTVDCYDK